MADRWTLQGKTAVVTGATAGIGLAIAEELKRHGATVLRVARGSEADIQADVTNADDRKRIFAGLERLDILVNNAGTNIRKAPQEYTLDEWRTVLDTNLTSAFLCSRAAHPAFKRAGGGKVINIGSMMSIFGASFAGPYSASKGGIVQFTKSMAVAWAKDNIQVNAILPGWIDTDLTRRARQQIDTLHDSVLRRTPAGRWGVIDDFNGIAVFLGGPASDFITGAVITVDGGFSIQG